MIVGLPGAGKTLLVSKLGIQSMKKGKKVYSNYGLIDSWKLDFNLLPGVRNAMVALDEAASLADSRDFMKFPASAKLILQQNRKKGIDLYYTTQCVGAVEKTFRYLTEDVWLVNNMFGRIFMARKYRIRDFDSDGNIKEKSKAFSWKIWWLGKKLRESYDTNQIIDNDELLKDYEQKLADDTYQFKKPELKK